jgi:hypothetical protein
MFNNDLNRIRSGFIAGAIAALIFALPSGLFAQSSPLTVQPSTGRVGVGTTDPTRTLTVQGTAIVGQSATAPGILLQTNGSIADITGINAASNAFNGLQFTTGATPSLSLPTTAESASARPIRQANCTFLGPVTMVSRLVAPITRKVLS